MTRSAIATLVVVVLASPATAGNEVRVAFVAEHEALVVGTQHVAVTFTMEPEWHIYWSNPGDSGLPTEVAVTSATQGVTLGTPLFPAPHRYERKEADSVDFVYEGEVTVLVPVTVAQGVTTVSLEAKASWLVCKQACIPGEGQASLKLPVAASAGEPTEHALSFARTRARLATAAPDDVTVAWSGLELVVAAPGATRLVLFPLLPDQAPPTDAFERGAINGAEVRLTYPERARAGRLKALLELHRADKTTFHWIEIAAPKRSE